MLFGGLDALKADLSAQRGVRQHQSHTDNNHTLRCLLEYVSYSPNHNKAAKRQQIRQTHVIANCEWYNTMTPPQREGVSTYPLIPDFFLHSQIYKVSKVRYAPSFIYRSLRTSSQFTSAGKVETLEAMANYVQAKFEL